MNIREMIPELVEEVVAGVEACRKQGLDVFPPSVIEIEIPTPRGAVVKVTVPLLPAMRLEGKV